MPQKKQCMLKNIELNENKAQEDLKESVFEVLKNVMKLDNDIIKDMDKIHRSRYVKKFNGIKKQNIIIQFKSHKSRYLFLL